MIRQYFVIDDIVELQAKHQWPGLQSIGLARSIRTTGSGLVVEERFYLNSYCGDIEEFAHAVRAHWSIENNLHWCLDASLFNEDKSRVRKGNAPENLAVLRHMALNLHKKNPQKQSLRAKAMLCLVNTDYIINTLIS